MQSGTSIGAIVTPIIVAAMLTAEPGMAPAVLWIGGAGLLGGRLVVGGDAQAGSNRRRLRLRPKRAVGPRLSWPSCAATSFWLLVVVVCCINGVYSVYRV
ncbi:MAG: hypothetical protein R2748_24260 [Bryobacterales bacterium]